jgi:hypothetical protein
VTGIVADVHVQDKVGVDGTPDDVVRRHRDVDLVEKGVSIIAVGA